MRSIGRFVVIYCATVIGAGLAINGYSRIKSYTYVPEFHPVEITWPSVFESTAVCVGCKYEAWQNVYIGIDVRGDEHWRVHDILVRPNDNGIGGDLGGNCKEEPTVEADDPQELKVASILVTH